MTTFAAPLATEYTAFIGTYTGKKSKGIYAYRFNTQTGKLTELGLAAETINPSFLAIHPSQKYLYAIGEGGTGTKQGAIVAFGIDAAQGKLTRINQQSTVGAGPCSVAVDISGRCALAANYGSGSVVSLPIKADGSLGEAASFFQHAGSSIHPQRQTGPHAHSTDVDPGNRFAFFCDLGMDKVMIYQLDLATAKLTPHNPPFTSAKPGAGPRHLAFHPNGKYVFVINELDNTLVSYTFDSGKGTLTEIHRVPTLPEGFAEKSTCAEVQVHPNGKFVYGSNRGHDSIAVFSVEPASGKLTFVEHQSSQGKSPRYFTLDPTGSWLIAAHQSSDNMVVFQVDPQTGKLKPTGQNLEVGAPVCVKFVPVK